MKNPITNQYIKEIERLRAENLHLRSLLDGVTEVVELFGATPIQIAWRKAWLQKVKEAIG